MDTNKGWKWYPLESKRKSNYLADTLLANGALPPVLDIGAYRGELKQYLPKAYDYTGLDVTENKENNVREFNLNGLCFTDIPFPDKSFNTIVVADVFEHILYPEILLMECKRLLKDGGIALFSFPNERGLKGRISSVFYKDSDQTASTWQMQKDGWYHLWYFTPNIAREFINKQFSILQEYPYWGRVLSQIPLLTRFDSTCSSVVFICKPKPN